MKNHFKTVSLAVVLCLILSFVYIPASAGYSAAFPPKYEILYDYFPYDNMIFQNGIYVASNHSDVKTSENGIKWDDFGCKANTEGLAYGAGKFVAASCDIQISEDGKKWEYLGIDFLDSVSSAKIAYNGSLFVLYASGTYKGRSRQICMTSPDGINWETYETKIEHQVSLKAVSNVFYLTSGESIYKSTNGIDWETVDVSIPENITDVYYSNIYAIGNRIIVRARANGRYNAVSDDGGNTWALAQSSEELDGMLENSVFDGKQLVCFYGFEMYTSEDGANWTQIPTNNMPIVPKHIYYCNGKYFIRGEYPFKGENQYATSVNLLDWTLAGQDSKLGAIYGAGDNFNIPAGYNGINDIAAVGNTQIKITRKANSYVLSTLSYSKDGGDTWEIIENPMLGYANSVASNGKRFVIVSGYGEKAVSEDGINWTVSIDDSLPMDSFSNVIWDGEQFVSLFGSGTIYYSADGINWKRWCSIRSYDNPKLFWNEDNYLLVSERSVTMIEKPPVFKDIDSHWAKNDILNLVDRDILYGVGHTSFAPNRSITRAEFSAIVARALMLEDNGNYTDFADVKNDDWYYSAVQIAYQKGILRGYENNAICPNKPISREEAMVMLARAGKLLGLETVTDEGQADILLQAFEDFSSISDFAKLSVATCVLSEIVKGSENKIMPASDITRAETAAIISRLISI